MYLSENKQRLVSHHKVSAFSLGARRGTRTPKNFVDLTGESKNFKMLEFPLNQLQTHYGYLCSTCWQQRCLVILKLAIFLSQTESTPEHFSRKKALHKVIGFYNNRDEKCLQRGTDWVFK
jgi:hypothetical protein